jgi:hypothetical protein
MAYVCPKSYAKNLGVFFYPITKIVFIFKYILIIVWIIHIHYIYLIKYFVCLVDFSMPWYSSKLYAHIGKTKKNCILKILHGIMFFFHGPSIRSFSKKLTSMDMIIVIFYNFSPTHIIFTKCWISKMYKNLLIFLKCLSNFSYCKFQKTYSLKIVTLKITLWLCFS